MSWLATIAQQASGAAQPSGSAAPQGYGWPAIIGTCIGMVVVAFVAWKAVQRQEKGDAALEAKLKADDERAARGRAGH
jgi:L-lactate permease